MTVNFNLGQVYNRRQDIHGSYGGQRQGGIITPSDPKFPIFLITGAEGEAHGYSDRMRPDGVFEYFGEGQIGDMQMVRGNRAIQFHSMAGRDLLLFRKVKAGVRYEGSFVYETHHFTTSPDSQGNDRQAIVFELRAAGSISDADAAAEPLSSFDLGEMRRRAMSAARPAPERATQLTTAFERSRIICTYVFARAAGLCEFCSQEAPFLRSNGSPYLEAHHIRRLSDGGPDDPRFMIALCPNCHRLAHHGADRETVNTEMLKAVTRKEQC